MKTMKDLNKRYGKDVIDYIKMMDKKTDGDEDKILSGLTDFMKIDDVVAQNALVDYQVFRDLKNLGII